MSKFHIDDDETEVHEEFVKLDHDVGTCHEAVGFGWVEMPHWSHGDSCIFF